nr:hypothetical protein [Nocardioides zeae]
MDVSTWRRTNTSDEASDALTSVARGSWSAIARCSANVETSAPR